MSCSRCGRLVTQSFGHNPDGEEIWRCGECRVIGRGARAIGDPIPKRLPRAKRGPIGHNPMTFIRSPKRRVAAEAVP